METVKYFNIALICMTVFFANVGSVVGQTFEADSALAKRAATTADELTQFAQAQFQVKLDYSEESIEELDALLDQLHAMFIEEQPPETQLVPLAQGFGSYIGEVYRRQRGGSWGWITQDTEVYPGIKQAEGVYFWPWAKALDRIKTNDKPTISDYYHYIVIRLPAAEQRSVAD
ncbi:MAG: hypothetical protein ACU84Q_09545 [Gammaproteobacteria bacterium]